MWITTDDGSLVNLNATSKIGVAETLTSARFRIEAWVQGGEECIITLFVGTELDCKDYMRMLGELVKTVSLSK